MMAPRITHRNESKIIGIEVRASNLLENEASSTRISDLWKKFHNDKKRIPNKRDERTALGVYTSYQDNNNEYSLIVASEVTTLERVPEGMVSQIIPAGKYLIFAGKGHMPNAALSVWEQIARYFSNGAHYKRAYTVDFELHDMTKADEVEVHISII